MPQSVGKEWYIQRNAFKLPQPHPTGAKARLDDLVWVTCQTTLLGAFGWAQGQSSEQWRDAQRVWSHSLAPWVSGLWGQGWENGPSHITTPVILQGSHSWCHLDLLLIEALLTFVIVTGHLFIYHSTNMDWDLLHARHYARPWWGKHGNIP